MRKAVLVLALLVSILQTGCFGRVEINDLALVVAGALDVKKHAGQERILFTMQIANPMALVPDGGGGTGEKPFWTITGSGRDFRDAIDDAIKRMPKKPFFGQTRVLIIGEEAARKGIAFLDRALRSTEARPSNWLVLARGTGKSVLELEMPTFRASGLALNNLFQIQGYNDGIVPVSTNEFAYCLSTGNTCPVMPVVRVVPESSFQETARLPGGAPPKTIEIEGLGVFDYNGRLKGFLNPGETRGYLWIRGKARRNEVTARQTDKPDYLTALVISSQRKLEVKMAPDGIPQFKISVKNEAYLAEHYSYQHVTMNAEIFRDMERAIDKQIEKEMRSALRKCQLLGCDVFEFGEEVHRQHPREWQHLKDDWEILFPQVKVVVDSKTHISQCGLIYSAPPREVKLQ